MTSVRDGDHEFTRCRFGEPPRRLIRDGATGCVFFADVLEEHGCMGAIWEGTGWRRCGRTATYEYRDLWFCGTHHPPRVVKKRVAALQKKVGEE